METENEEEYLSLSKAAELLGVTTKTIRNSTLTRREISPWRKSCYFKARERGLYGQD
jgi:hypothetical protein